MAKKRSPTPPSIPTKKREARNRRAADPLLPTSKDDPSTRLDTTVSRVKSGEKAHLSRRNRTEPVRKRRKESFHHDLHPPDALRICTQEAISTSRSIRELFEKMVRILVRHAPFRQAWIGQMHEDGSLTIIASSERAASSLSRRMAPLSVPSLASRCWEEGKVVFSPPHRPCQKGKKTPPEPPDLACIPLFNNEKIVNVLVLVPKKLPRVPSEFFQGLAREISFGIAQIDAMKDKDDPFLLQTLLLDNADSGILLFQGHRIRLANKKLLSMLGYDHLSELTRKSTHRLFAEKEEFDRVDSLLSSIDSGHPLELNDLLLRGKKGPPLPCDLSVAPVQGPDERGCSFVATIRPSAPRHRQMAHLKRLSDFNTLLAKVGEAVGRNSDQLSLFQEVCTLAVTYAGLTLCWVGKPDSDGRFIFLASAGKTGYLKGLHISENPDDLSGRASAAPTYRDGRPIFNDSFTGVLHPWKARARKWGLESSATLPLFRSGKVFAVLTVYHSEEHAFDASLQEILLALSRSLSRGLDRIDLLEGERRSSALNSAILEASSLGILLTKKGLIHYANPRMEVLLGTPLFEMSGKSMLSLCMGRHLSAGVKSCFAGSLPKGEPTILEIPFPKKDGKTTQWFQFSGVPFSQEHFDTLWTISDVTSRRRIHEREALMAKALLSVQEGVVITDANYRVLYVNEAFGRISGYEFKEVKGRTCRFLQGPDTSPQVLEDLRTALYEGRSFRGQILNYRKNGSPFWNLLTISPVRDSNGEITQFVGVQRDITDMRDLIDQNSRLSFRAHHDSLTGLANRSALGEHLERLVSRMQRHEGRFAVAMIDLDDFKPINDTWGHAAGDQLLAIFAQRIGRSLRSHDLLARLGGDEFVAVIEDFGEDEGLEFESLLERIHTAVESPFELGPGLQIHIGMSMGLSFYPSDAIDAEGLLREADSALSIIKKKKHHRTRWWQTAHCVTSPEEDPPFDPYSKETAAILEKNIPLLESVISRFVEAFYLHLDTHPEAKLILESLSNENRQELLQRQKDHLRFLLSPLTTREAVLTRARKTGRIHCLVGLPNKVLVSSMLVYRRLLSEHLFRGLVPERERSLLLSVADLRIEHHVETELETEIGIINQYMETALTPPDKSLSAVQADRELRHLASLPGLPGIWLLRRDDTGHMVVEASAGRNPEFLIRPLEEFGNPFSDAMKGRLIFRNSCEDCQSEMRPLYNAFFSEGIRSTAEVPLCDESGHSRYLLLLGGAYTNQFGSDWMHQFIGALKQRLEGSSLLRDLGPTPIPSWLEDRWMETLLGGNLLMYFQPVQDLATGSVHSLEGLARLNKGKGQTLSARTVLSRMTPRQGDHLFRQGLRQALDSLHRMELHGLTTSLSLNIFSDLLRNPDLLRWIREALGEVGIPGNRLILEISCSGIGDGKIIRDSFKPLEDLGIRMALDDFGASRSDLELLAFLPCDIVKITPELTGQMRISPLETLSILHSMKNAAGEFGSLVVLKGLEDQGLLEAAFFGGFSLGQGYAVGEPVPSEEFPIRPNPPPLPLSTGHIDTSLGALAFLWQGIQENPPLPHPSLPHCPLTFFLANHPELSFQEEAERWHIALHSSSPAPSSLRHLLQWLVNQVQEEAGVTAGCY